MNDEERSPEMGEVRESNYAPFDVSDYLDSEEVIADC
jgi:hypothetical protein